MNINKIIKEFELKITDNEKNTIYNAGVIDGIIRAEKVTNTDFYRVRKTLFEFIKKLK